MALCWITGPMPASAGSARGCLVDDEVNGVDQANAVRLSDDRMGSERRSSPASMGPTCLT
jgi:hypothetical protein